jgi:asparagine synthase (glutamine-hydrolysing)
MCGIAGVYYFDPSREVEPRLIEEMTSRIAHRGPNGHGIFLDGNLALGHRRLSVIDIEGGAQPMTDEESGRTIAYNGEFFNFAEARDRLRHRGHSFRTQSDTEVLLKLAVGSVSDWMPQVNGMFAFALWDARDRSLTLVRDRFGVKPLYYSESSEGIVFASEIKALIGIGPGPRPEIDQDSLAEYLAFRHVLEPRTLFKGIRELPSGHFMRIRSGSTQIEIKPFWSEVEEPFPGVDYSGDRGEFEGLFAQAVRRRLVSDVPLGSFNSGGVDSSLVTREVRRQRSGELHTFSVGFTEQEYDESAYAGEVARKLGTSHHAEYLPAAEYASLLPAAIWHNDEPLCHPHSVQLMHLSGIARQFVTVVLTGEGADELFCGYPRLHIPRIARLLGPVRCPLGFALDGLSRRAGLRRSQKLAEVMGNRTIPEIDSHRFLPLGTLHRLGLESDYVGARPEAFRCIRHDQPALERLLEYERNSYMKSLLVRLDKMTMAHGLEARTPFLDFELVLWSKQMQRSDKLGIGWQNKSALKDEAVRHFSRQLVHRGKVGFGVPLSEWFRSQPEFRDMLADFCRPGSFVASILPVEVARTLVSEHCEKGISHTEALWGLLNLELWSASMLHQPSVRP